MNGAPRFVDLTVEEQTRRLAELLYEHEEDSRFPFRDRGAQQMFDNRCAIVAGRTGRTFDAVVADVRSAANAIPEARRRALREEADRRAHDHVSPEAVYEAIAAVNLYVVAFEAGAKYEAERHKKAASS
jgi:hypothetical protein